MNVAYRMLVVLVAAVACCASSWAQTPYMEMHFGIHAGMRFDTSLQPTALRGPLLTEEGTATWCDPVTGALRMTTDGRAVYNGQKQVMSNGSGLLGGSSSTQGVAILPMPGTNGTRLYVFTVEELSPDRPSTLRFSTVDMSLDGGLGGVVSKNVVLASSVGEKISIVPHCDRRSWWVVTHDAFRARFLAFRVAEAGFIDTTVSTFPTDRDPVRNHSTGAYGRGMLMPSPQADRLAMASTDASALELYDFDNETGAVTNRRFISGAADYYGVMFSPSGKVLYVTSWYDVYAVDLHDLSAIRLPQKLGAIPSARFGSVFRGGITMGPDRTIYLAAGDAVMGIPNPDGGALASGYGSLRIPLYEGTETAVGMPNVTMDFLVPEARTCLPPRPSIDFDTVICAGECVTFTDRSLNTPTTWDWAFDGGSVTTYAGKQPPRICYRFPGIYKIRLRVANDVGVDSTVRTIRVAFRPAVDAGDSVFGCSGAPVILRATGAERYHWSPSMGLDNDSSATPIVAHGISGWYTVVGTTADGCVGTDSVYVRQERFADVPLGDTVVCAGGTIVFPPVTADSVVWSPPDGLTDPRAVEQRFSGTTSRRYEVRIWRGPCDTTVSVAVTVMDLAADTVRFDDVCAGDRLRLQAPEGRHYRWSAIPGGNVPPAGLADLVTPAGFHRVTVTVDLGGGCARDRVFEWSAHEVAQRMPQLVVQRYLEAGTIDTITLTVPDAGALVDPLLELDVPAALFSTIDAGRGVVVADVMIPGAGTRRLTLAPDRSVGTDAAVVLYVETMLMPARDVRLSVGGRTGSPCGTIGTVADMIPALDGCYHEARPVVVGTPAAVAVSASVPMTVDVRGRLGASVTIDVWSVHGTLLFRRHHLLSDEHVVLPLEGFTAPPACFLRWRVGAETGVLPVLVR